MGGGQKGKNKEKIKRFLTRKRSCSGNMAQSIEISLLQAIIKDDTEVFGALTEKARCGAYRLGRFPVLSLMYLYKSRKLLRAYEARFLKISEYEVLREPAEISKKFSSKAGKCLRLYFGEVVSPPEMLLILNKTRRLKRVFPSTKPSAAVKERLKAIYRIRYSLSVAFEGDKIVIDRRPLSYREKKTIAAVCVCALFTVSVAVAVPVTINALTVDLTSSKEYTLKRDLVLKKSVDKVNCTIIGNGHKMIVGNGVTLGKLNGKISDLTIESPNQAVFKSVSESATIENVTLNVNADITASGNTALVAETNYGTIEGVTVNVSGKINAVAPSSDVLQELTFGGLVSENAYKTSESYGIIKNCTVNYSDFRLVGEAGANASFGGVAGINNGYVEDCSVTGKILSDTFDIAGVCSLNNGLLSGNVNSADLSQISSDTEWNPVTCGIVLTNAYVIDGCENRGKISSVSTCGKVEISEEYEAAASASGIVYLNRSTALNTYSIINCVNSGRIECSAENRNAYAAGLCISSNSAIARSKNSGEVKSESGTVAHAAGIAAVSEGDIMTSANTGAVFVKGGTAYAGGISAYALAQIENCFSDGDITVTAQKVFAGGIFAFGDVASNGLYIYWGVAERCISDCKIKVSVTGDDPACVGGIAGYFRQAKLDGSTPMYFGGCVINCYFTGSSESENDYFGNIAGVLGANVYEKNSYVSGNREYPNFEGNYYLNNSFGAFGATLSEDGGYATAQDKGATSATIGEIQNSEIYKSILSEFTEIGTNEVF